MNEVDSLGGKSINKLTNICQDVLSTMENRESNGPREASLPSSLPSH